MKRPRTDYLVPLGRALIGLVFVQSALGKLQNAPGVMESIAAHGLVPAEPFFAASTGLELLGGLSLLFGYRTRLGALALLLFLIPVTATYHAFWAVPAEEVMEQRFAFMGNLAIMGGLVYVLGMGAGPVSVDARRERLVAEELAFGRGIPALRDRRLPLGARMRQSPPPRRSHGRWVHG